MQQQQLHEHTLVNTPSIGQMMQNGDNCLAHRRLMLPERPGIDMPPSLVFLSPVTNTVTAALTLMCASTPVRTGMRAAASSWKPRIISSCIYGWSAARCLVGWKELAVL